MKINLYNFFIQGTNKRYLRSLQMEEIKKLLAKLSQIESIFLQKYHIDDIYSNSKIYEILIANCFGHTLIPGHSGSRDAKDKNNNEIEYKHFKESSSNHTWTFNDFSDTTIAKLGRTPWVYFVYVDDSNYAFPGRISWYFKVEGKDIAAFLTEATKRITNTRKMINVSVRNLESINYEKIVLPDFNMLSGNYGKELNSIVETIHELEEKTKTHGLLTSNKIWELLIAIHLKHTVNSEQGGREGSHDASDKEGNLYEYKISKQYSWNFQDISENVLKKYLSDKQIILAVVNKTSLSIKSIYVAEPRVTVSFLRAKLNDKIKRYAAQGKEIRRLQVSISKGDLKKIKAVQIF